MSKKYEMTEEEIKAESKLWSENLARGAGNWRAWGSWFSWGSPVGLGLFFIEIAIAVWIFAHLTK